MGAKIARVKGLRLIDLFLTKYIQFSTVFFFLFFKIFFNSSKLEKKTFKYIRKSLAKHG